MNHPQQCQATGAHQGAPVVERTMTCWSGGGSVHLCFTKFWLKTLSRAESGGTVAQHAHPDDVDAVTMTTCDEDADWVMWHDKTMHRQR